MTRLILGVFILSISFTLSAQDFAKNGMDTTHIPKGLEVGEKAPDIKLKSVDGKFFSLYDSLEHKKVVLIFYRGQWCPYCSRHLSSLNDSLKLIHGKNAIVVAIGPETIENAKKMQEKTGNGFILLTDDDLQVMTDYDVLFTVTESYTKKIKRFLSTDISKNNGQKSAKLPVPATYVIGKDGTVAYRHFEYDYKTRSTVKEILGAL